MARNKMRKNMDMMLTFKNYRNNLVESNKCLISMMDQFKEWIKKLGIYKKKEKGKMYKEQNKKDLRINQY